MSNRCWDWLRCHPEHTCALVRGAFFTNKKKLRLSLEDDVCFDTDFRSMWDAIVVPHLQPSPNQKEYAPFDCLVLGYSHENGSTPRHIFALPPKRWVTIFLEKISMVCVVWRSPKKCDWLVFQPKVGNICYDPHPTG